MIRALFSALLLVVFGSCASPAAAQTWYVHSGYTGGSRDGTASKPYNTIREWHTAVNGGGFSTSGIGVNSTLIVASSETSHFRDGPLTLNFEGNDSRNLTVRAWETADGVTDQAGLRQHRPILRGDVLLTSLTLDGGTGYYFSEVLPADVTSVRMMLYRWDDAARYTNEGFPTGAFACTDQAGNPGAGTVAANNAVYVTSTRRIWINTSGLSTTAADYAYCASAYSTAEKTNAGLCFQNARRCHIDGLEAWNFYEPTGGWYGFSMENATNSSIRRCRTVNTTHHGVGFTGTSSPGNANCVIEACEVFGLSKSGGSGIFIGNSQGVDNVEVRDCTVHLFPTLGPAGSAWVSINLGAALTGSATAASHTRIVFTDCRFLFYPSLLMTSTVSGLPLCLTNAAPSDPTNEATYGTRFVRCSFERMSGVTYQSSGPTHAAAYVECQIDFSGYATTTGGLSLGGVISAFGGGANTSYHNFTRSIVTAHQRAVAGQYPCFVTCYPGSGTSLAESQRFYFVDSALLWIGGKTPPTSYQAIFQFSGGAAGQMGMRIYGRRSIFGFQNSPIREAASGTGGDRPFIEVDTNATTGAGGNIDLVGCGYWNIRETRYSVNTARDTAAEWFSTGPGGVRLTSPPLVGYPPRVVIDTSTMSAADAALFARFPTHVGPTPTIPPRLRGRQQ